MTPSLSVVVPTIGRKSLERTLDAIVTQLEPADEVLVIGDRHYASLPYLCARVQEFGPQVTYYEIDGGRCFYGVDQTNYGMTLARADYILLHADDDVYVAGAFARLRSVASEHQTHPIVFRSLSFNRRLSWDDGKPALQHNRIGSASLCCPRDLCIPYVYPCDGSMDFNWLRAILETATRLNRPPVWIDDVLMVCRPSRRHAA